MPKLPDNDFYIYISFKKTFFNKSFIDSTPSKSPSDGVKYFFLFRKDFINPMVLAMMRLLRMNRSVPDCHK